ncbi:uncharacterized protein LOC110348062 [Heterocephalus glaber]|uniref:Uncharacterized protein LOC110348062 n=1 Tax=Heterocephalus glaber TaxID=10181 RepID=A0AAX6SKJ0_HETGA|nr:uncharacterized protein LOC110348062 [Heterocephalus glaber]
MKSPRPTLLVCWETRSALVAALSELQSLSYPSCALLCLEILTAPQLLHAKWSPGPLPAPQTLCSRGAHCPLCLQSWELAFCPILRLSRVSPALGDFHEFAGAEISLRSFSQAQPCAGQLCFFPPGSGGCSGLFVGYTVSFHLQHHLPSKRNKEVRDHSKGGRDAKEGKRRTFLPGGSSEIQGQEWFPNLEVWLLIFPLVAYRISVTEHSALTDSRPVQPGQDHQSYVMMKKVIGES